MPVGFDLTLVQKSLDWLKAKLSLELISNNAKTRVVRRGQVYWCNFGIGVGSEIRKLRPAIIIQNNVGNIHSGNTIVIPITHGSIGGPCTAQISTYYAIDGTVLLDGRAATSNMRCVSKARLGDYITTLNGNDMLEVDRIVAKEIGLMSYYSNLEVQLNDKMSYIDKLKEDRNSAQDTLKKICSELGIAFCADSNDLLIILQKYIDNSK
jgi:mRNA interferase MazF